MTRVSSSSKTTPPAADSQKADASQVNVKKGDTLSSIAKDKGVSVAQLKEANPQLKGDAIKAGQVLTLPSGAPVNTPPTTPDTTPPATRAAPSRPADGGAAARGNLAFAGAQQAATVGAGGGPGAAATAPG